MSEVFPQKRLCPVDAAKGGLASRWELLLPAFSAIDNAYCGVIISRVKHSSEADPSTKERNLNDISGVSRVELTYDRAGEIDSAVDNYVFIVSVDIPMRKTTTILLSLTSSSVITNAVVAGEDSIFM